MDIQQPWNVQGYMDIYGYFWILMNLLMYLLKAVIVHDPIYIMIHIH